MEIVDIRKWEGSNILQFSAGINWVKHCYIRKCNNAQRTSFVAFYLLEKSWKYSGLSKLMKLDIALEKHIN